MRQQASHHVRRLFGWSIIKMYRQAACIEIHREYYVIVFSTIWVSRCDLHIVEKILTDAGRRVENSTETLKHCHIGLSIPKLDSAVRFEFAAIPGQNAALIWPVNAAEQL